MAKFGVNSFPSLYFIKLKTLIKKLVKYTHSTLVTRLTYKARSLLIKHLNIYETHYRAKHYVDLQ